MRTPLAAILALAALLASGCAGMDGDGAPSTSTSGTGTAPGTGTGTTGGTQTGTTAPPPAGGPAKADLFEDFEGGLSNWTADAEVPADPNRPGNEVAWNITRGDNGWEGHVHVVGHPTHGARFRIDGRQDDGAIWLERAIQLQAGKAYRVNVTFQAWSPSESFNVRAHVLASATGSSPERETDFPEPGQNLAWGLREPLDQKEGWMEYGFGGTTPVLADGRLHVAVGIAAVWETELQFDVDAIRIVVQAV